jgi:RNA polymerase sigma-70 factor (ECF subfamily)
MFPGETTDSREGQSRFNTTRWSVVLASCDAQTGDEKSAEALAQLCRIYWRPIFAFVVRRVPSQEDAEDLTQDFFLTITTGNLLRRADPERGRFRSLLLKAVKDFVNDARDRARTRRRGGEINFVSWDEWMAEAPSRLMLPVAAEKSWPAEKVFDVRWAATVAEQALRRLQEECEAHKRPRVFDVLSGALTADRQDIAYEPLAQELGVKPPEIKRLLHRLRQRYRELLRAEIAETVADPADVDEEVRYLVGALSAGMEAANESA